LINNYVTKTKAELERCYNLVAATGKKVTAAMVKEALPSKTTRYTLMHALVLHNDEFAVKVKFRCCLRCRRCSVKYYRYTCLPALWQLTGYKPWCRQCFPPRGQLA
jgi:hypothetical protein